jgi:hypothetical protein
LEFHGENRTVKSGAKIPRQKMCEMFFSALDFGGKKWSKKVLLQIGLTSFVKSQNKESKLKQVPYLYYYLPTYQGNN